MKEVAWQDVWAELGRPCGIHQKQVGFSSDVKSHDNFNGDVSMGDICCFMESSH